MLATVGNVRIQSPVAQGGVTAVGFHGSDEGALVLHPVGPQANEGLLARLWRRIRGSTSSGLGWYQLEGGEPRTLDVGAVACVLLLARRRNQRARASFAPDVVLVGH